MGQSPTSGRPAPQIRLEIRFRGGGACKNLRGKHPIRAKIQSLVKNHLGGSAINMSVYNFLLVDQSSPNFFRRIGAEMQLTNRSSVFQVVGTPICSWDICDQIRKLSEIAQNFERFSPSQILLGAPSKFCIHVITLPRGTSPGNVFCGNCHQSQIYRQHSCAEF